MTRTHWILVVFAALAAGSSKALEPLLTRECLIARSDVVLVGVVTRVGREPVLVDRIGRVMLVDVDYESVLKGTLHGAELPAGEFQFLYRPDFSESANPIIGQKYIMFFADSPVGPHLVNDIQGLQPFDAKQVKALASLSDIIESSGKDEYCRTE